MPRVFLEHRPFDAIGVALHAFLAKVRVAAGVVVAKALVAPFKRAVLLGQLPNAAQKKVGNVAVRHEVVGRAKFSLRVEVFPEKKRIADAGIVDVFVDAALVGNVPDRIKEHLAVAAAVVGRHHDAGVVVNAVLTHPVEPRGELHREGALGQVVAVVVVGMGLAEVRGRSRLR